MSVSHTNPSAAPVRPASRWRAGRYLLVAVLVILAAAGILWALGRHYLASPRVAALVASRLGEAYGGTVEVGQAEIGMAGSSVNGLKLYEHGAKPSEKPWAEVQQVQADLSLWDLLRGQAQPHEITLSGARATLRFDRAGHLLTKLPRPAGTLHAVPHFHLVQGQLTIQQEDRPDFVIHDIDADLHDNGGQLLLDGTVHDPEWGEWSVRGSVDRKTEAGSLTLNAPRRHVTPEQLDRLPFVPRTTWRQVQCEGDTPVAVEVRLEPGAKGVHYRITLTPEKTRVHVSSIDLSAEDARGTVLVEDKVVRLTGVQGRTADGVLQTDANLDFRGRVSELQFKVRAEHLDLQQLPKKWKLPHQIKGRLSGQADIQVAVQDGKARPTGEGQGVITEAWLGKFPVRNPIPIRLHTEGGRFRFTPQGNAAHEQTRLPASRAALLAAACLVAADPEPQPDDTFLPARIANWVGAGIGQGVEALTRAGSDLLARLPQPRSGPAQPQQAPNYLDVNLSLQDVQLDELARGIGVPLPFPIRGRVSFRVQVGIPLDTARDLKAYRLNGTATSRRLTLAGLQVDQVHARVEYANGILRLEELSGTVPPVAAEGRGARGEGTEPAGTFRGTARMGLVPEGDLLADLSLEHIPLAQALSLLPRLPGGAQGQGVFSSTLRVQLPVARLRDPMTWQGTGTLRAQRLGAFGLVLEDLRADAVLNGGSLRFKDLTGLVEKTPVVASANLTLTQPYRYDGQVRLRRADLAALEHLAPEFRPPVRVEGEFSAQTSLHGELSPPRVEMNGTGSGHDLRVQNVDIRSVAFHWKSVGDQLRITDLRANLYRGTVTGSAALPLRAAATGEVDLRFADVDVGALAQAEPAVPIHAEGRASGTLRGTLTAAGRDHKRQFKSELDLQAPSLRLTELRGKPVQIPARRLRGTLSYSNGAFAYRFSAEVFGGTMEISTPAPPADAKPAPPPGEGRLRIEGVELGRLAAGLGYGRVLRPLRGTLDVDLRFGYEGPEQEAVGGGQFAIRQLRWGTSELLGGLRGDLTLAGQELRIQNLSGGLGQGRVRGQLILNLREFSQSRFALAFYDIEASRLLAPWPDLASRIQGPFDARVRGRLGREWYGSGELIFTRGRVEGIEVADWRLPLDWYFAPGSGRGQVAIRDTSGMVAQGRVTVRATLGWGWGTQLDGEARFSGLELRSLFRQAADLSQVGTGQATGRLTFSGTDVHSLEDVTARLDATLRQTQALQLPILQQIAPFLLPGSSSSAYFQSGDVRARLVGGVIRVERLAFSGSTVQLVAEGTVTPAGRLNLEVTARTGRIGPSPLLLRVLRLRVPLTGPIPYGLLLQGTNLLSNQLVHLRVMGTVRSPVVVVEPVSLLTQTAFLFFLNQANVPLP